MKITFRILSLLLIFSAFSCGSHKKVASRKKQKMEHREEKENPMVQVERIEKNEAPIEGSKPVTYVDKVNAYIALYAPIAQEEMHLYKIPASITLAQGILESGAGQGTLTLKANNHFGIKCHGWAGGSVFHDDDRPQECFRKYNDPKYSFRDHSLFLTERKRYAGLFELDIDDYKGWAHGLRDAGYATDRKYPAKLISLIERYELYKYDGELRGNKSSVVYNEKRSEARQYVVKQGDTLYAISKKFGITVEQLQRYNNIKGTEISIGQVLFVAR
ncbi:MAG: glucosaminidase domain-containing protein [Salinimicrobium sp.]